MQKHGKMCIATYKDNSHWVTLAKLWNSLYLGWLYRRPSHQYIPDLEPKNKKILTRNVTFLQTTYGEYTKVEKSVVITTSNEGSDREEELKTDPLVINNNNVNVVNDSQSDSSKEDFKNNSNNFFDDYINDQVKASPQTTVHAKVVQAMKKQASYNDDANKIIKQATHQKSAIKNLNFLIESCTWRTQELQWSLEPSQHELFNEIARSNQKEICQHEQTTGLAHDKQKSYAP